MIVKKITLLTYHSNALTDVFLEADNIYFEDFKESVLVVLEGKVCSVVEPCGISKANDKDC